MSMSASSQLHHQGDDVGGAQLDGGLRVMSMDELREKRKKIGICLTCGQTRTHKPGIWKSLIPETIEGVVYKGICLKCSTLDAAKLNLGIPLTHSSLPDDMERSRDESLERSRRGRSLPRSINSSSPSSVCDQASIKSRASSQSNESKISLRSASKYITGIRLKRVTRLDKQDHAKSTPKIYPIPIHEAEAPDKSVEHYNIPMRHESNPREGGKDNASMKEIKKKMYRRSHSTSRLNIVRAKEEPASLMSSRVMVAGEILGRKAETGGKEDGQTKRTEKKMYRRSRSTSRLITDRTEGEPLEENLSHKVEAGGEEDRHTKRIRPKTDRPSLRASMPPLDPEKNGMVRKLSSRKLSRRHLGRRELSSRHIAHSGEKEHGGRIRRKSKKGHLGASMPPVDLTKENPGNLDSTGGTTSKERPRPQVEPGGRDHTNRKSFRRKREKGHLSASMPPADLTKNDSLTNLISTGETAFEKSFRLNMEKAHLRASMPPMDCKDMPLNLINTQGLLIEEGQGRSIESRGNKVVADSTSKKKPLTGTRNLADDLSQLDHPGNSMDMDLDSTNAVAAQEQEYVQLRNNASMKEIEKILDRHPSSMPMTETSEGEPASLKSSQVMVAGGKLSHKVETGGKEDGHTKKFRYFIDRPSLRGSMPPLDPKNGMVRNLSSRHLGRRELSSRKLSSRHIAHSGEKEKVHGERMIRRSKKGHLSASMPPVDLRKENSMKLSIPPFKESLRLKAESGGRDSVNRKSFRRGTEKGHLRAPMAPMDRRVPNTQGLHVDEHQGCSIEAGGSKDDAVLTSLKKSVTGTSTKADWVSSKLDHSGHSLDMDLDSTNAITAEEHFQLRHKTKPGGREENASMMEIKKALDRRSHYASMPNIGTTEGERASLKSSWEDVHTLQERWDVDSTGHSSISSGSDLLLKQAASDDDDCSMDEFHDFNSDCSSCHTVHKTDTSNSMEDKSVSAAIKMMKDRGWCDSDDSCSYSYHSSDFSGSYHSSDWTSGSSYSYYSSDFTSSSSFYSSDSTSSQSDHAGAKMGQTSSKTTSSNDCNTGKSNSHAGDLVEKKSTINSGDQGAKIGADGVNTINVDECNDNFNCSNNTKPDHLGGKMEHVNHLEGNKLSDTSKRPCVEDTKNVDTNGRSNHKGIEASKVKLPTIDSPKEDYSYHHTNQLLAKIEALSEIEDEQVLDGTNTSRSNPPGEAIELAGAKATHNDVPIFLGEQIKTFGERKTKQISSGAKLLNGDDFDSNYSNSYSDQSKAKEGALFSTDFSGSCQESDFKTLNQETKKTKKGKFCPTCGVRTHSIGSLLPETVEGLVHKGTCLECNDTNAAKLKLEEPLIECPDKLQRSGSDNSRRSSLQATQIKFDLQDDPNGDAIARTGNHSADGAVSKLLPPFISTEGTTQKVDDRNYFFTEKSPSSKAKAIAERELKMNNNETKEKQISKSAKYPSQSKVDTSGKTAATELTESLSLRISSMTLSTAASTKTGNDSSKRTKTLPGRKEEIGTVVHCRKRGYGAQSGPPKSKVSECENVNSIRCCDSNEKWGFYTGTLSKDVQPHGIGEMVYDDGHIEKGIWSDGTIIIGEKSEQERYKPCRLPGYTIGDVAQTDAMAQNSREENVVAVSKLHVGDCAFINRSDGTYTYAIVKSRLDDISITFQVDYRGSSKCFDQILQWNGIKLPAKQDALPDYTLDEPGISETNAVTEQQESPSHRMSSTTATTAASTKSEDCSSKRDKNLKIRKEQIRAAVHCRNRDYRRQSVPVKTSFTAKDTRCLVKDAKVKQHKGFRILDFRTDYKLGDTIRSPSHMITEHEFGQAMQVVESLQKHDFAFIKRSNGSYSYAMLAQRSVHQVEKGYEQNMEEYMIFVLDGTGATKMIGKRRWSEMVRVVSI